MAMKALDIFKLLPKTNCKDCGCPTCLAFAMKLAQKQASLEECPHVSDESKAAMEGSAAPPIALVTIGTGDDKLEIGNETVMFRHEESFYHPPGIGTIVSDTLDDAGLSAAVEAIKKLKFTRVGAEIKSNIVAVDNESGNADSFVKTVNAVKALGLPMVLMSKEAAHIEKALESCADQKPLIHAANESNCDAFAAIAAAKGCPLAVAGTELEKLAELTEKIKAAGVKDMVLDLSSDSVAKTIQGLTAVRRMALKKNLRALGYPCMAVSSAAETADEVMDCITFISKYAGIVLSKANTPEAILPLLTLVQNIYTDPRKPIQCEAKLYTVGAVTPESPLLITTNFSLTYFTVEGEVEASRIPAYIGVIDTDGTSVLTAYASDKMTSEKIAAFLDTDEVKSAVSHRKVIIPGYVSVMSGALEEDASGWEVMVGPREASGISKYLKTVWKAG